jgi:hypothetical protein
MITAIRFLVVLSIALLLAGASISFDQPLDVDLPLHGALPGWVTAFLALMCTALLAVVAAIGFLRLRRWARALAIAVTVCGAVAVWFLIGSPLAGALSDLTPPLLGLSTLAWIASIGLAYHPSVTSRFGPER